MFEKVPPQYNLLALAGVLLAGPVACIAFLLGGAYAGIGVLLGLMLLYIALYIIVGRRYM
jgi:hypothetical protein